MNKILILGLIGVGFFLLFHHFVIHGFAFDINDGEKALRGLFGSHEGIIIALVLITIGVLIANVCF